jgi:dienelactone hydrolase
MLTVMIGCMNSDSVTDWPIPEELKPWFSPPPEFENEYGEYRSPLLTASGERIEDVEEWTSRRNELLKEWHGLLGEWPEILENPEIEYFESIQRGSIMQHRVEVEVAPGWTRNAYLLLPDLEGPLPAALVVYYDAETGAGLEGELRDFAWQLAQRGFVTLSLGSDYDTNYYPDEDSAVLQPLSMLAYIAANSYHVLANLAEVDPERIGIVGHSYGGKWAMFASSLYDKFALGVWSDGGIVFDESRANVNYWEPWYLGYEQGVWRERGIPSDENPRTGPYRQMIKNERNLHELHALMAPRPFLVSGGSEDPPERWKALNHTVDVNRLMGHENRVAMHNRPTHSPNEESNEIIYHFFEHFLK